MHSGATPLSTLDPGHEATVRRVPDDPALLRYLGSLGLLPGEAVEVVAVAPFDGPVTVAAGGGEHAISVEVAARIGVA